MLTPDSPMLIFWRMQKANKHLSDEFIRDEIDTAYTRVDTIATRQMTPGARDLAASYVVRLSGHCCDERQSLTEIVAMLTGGDL